jgi:hypothetical protein
MHGTNVKIITYLLIPWCRVLLEKLTGFAASQETPRICKNYYIIKFMKHNGSFSIKNTENVKGRAIPLQDWTGPEGSRRFRLPDFKTIGT